MPNYFLLPFLVLLTACGTGLGQRDQSAGGTDLKADERATVATLVYACNGFDFIARSGTEEITLWLPDQQVILPQVRSASGALYEADDISFWSKGDEAMLTVGADVYQNCLLQPHRVPWEDARRRGVDFRAVGNEPGWYLEIRSGREMLFVSDFGAQRLLVTDSGARREGNVRVHDGVSGGQAFRVDIIEESCIDTMSGQRFPARVTVSVDDRQFSGCGQNLDYPWDDFVDD
jgi:putative lipoprotein